MRVGLWLSKVNPLLGISGFTSLNVSTMNKLHRLVHQLSKRNSWCLSWIPWLLNSWLILLSWTQHLSCHSAVNTVHLTLIIWVFPSNWTRNRSIILNLIRLKQRLHLQQKMFYKQYLFFKSTFKNVPIAYSRYKLLFLEMFLNFPWKHYGSKDYF